jgi:hypothetical protein
MVLSRRLESRCGTTQCDNGVILSARKSLSKDEFALVLFYKERIKKATNMLEMNTLNEVGNVSKKILFCD